MPSTLGRFPAALAVAALSLFLFLLGAAPAASAQVPSKFIEKAQALGLDHEFVSGFDRIGDSIILDTLQQGVSVGDIDGDGDLDVFACGGAGTNSVFRNDIASFFEVTPYLDLNPGEFDRVAAMADYDRDGDLDLFVGALDGGNGPRPGRSRIYANQGLGLFDEVTVLSGVFGAGHSIFAQWADIDLDGLADLYVSEFHGTRNVWYRNNGDSTFTELAAALGIDHVGSAHATGVADTDGDRRPDLFVANDWLVSLVTGMQTNGPDAHFHHLPDHTFADVTPGSGYEHFRGIMGIAFGDVDYDGDFDIYKTDIDANKLMVNHGWPTSAAPWTEEQAFYKVGNPIVPDFETGGTGRSVGWAAIFMNADFDPWQDLFVVNGRVSGGQWGVKFSPANQPNLMFGCNGPVQNFTFRNKSRALGFTQLVDDRGAAVGDLDLDGDLDLLVTPTNGKLRYYENNVDRMGQGWVAVEAVTNTSAPHGLGVVAKYTDSLGYPHLRIIGADGPTASQHENRAYFAIGSEPAVDLTVTFPSGIELTFPQVAPDTEVTAVEPELIQLPATTVGIDPLGAQSQFTVTAFAHDAAGQALGAGANVTIDAVGLQAAGPVTNVSGNQYERTFLTPTAPGSHRVLVAFDGFQVRIEPQVHFYDRTDPSGTTARLAPEAVRAGSGELFSVRVAPKSAGGTYLTEAQTVDVQIAGIPLLLGPWDPEGDGLLDFYFLGPLAAGGYPVTLTVDGVVVPVGLALEVGGAADAAQTVVDVQVPNPNNSAGEHQLKVLVTPRDAGGNRLGPLADVQVVPVPDPGTPLLVVRDFVPGGQADGEFPFVVEKPLAGAAATGMLQIHVDGVLVASLPYAF